MALGQRTQAMDAVEQLLVAGGNDARRVAEIAVQVSGASKDIEMACEWKPLPAGDWDRRGLGQRRQVWGHVCDLGRSAGVGLGQRRQVGGMCVIWGEVCVCVCVVFLLHTNGYVRMLCMRRSIYRRVIVAGKSHFCALPCTLGIL